MKDDLINLKNYIHFKKNNLKRVCENDEAETHAKNLKNKININDNVDVREVMAFNNKLVNISEKHEDSNKKDKSSSPERVIQEDEEINVEIVSTQIKKK